MATSAYSGGRPLATQSDSTSTTNIERWKRAETLFLEALEKTAEQRRRFLEEQCAGAPELLEEVERLLSGHARSAGFLEPPSEGLSTDGDADAHFAMLEGRRIGRHRLRRRIASGGMGVVYEAEQDEPQRVVAVKILRAGVSLGSASRRFRDESAILGRLSHPCIAQVYDAGTVTLDTGVVPYFAMEYVEGARTITRFAEECALNHKQRLELFLRVCDAVQHGHQQGVVHRDIKPDNILVDASGCPKVIDFGVARVLYADRSITKQTVAGQLIGTLAYASPEQIEGDPDRVDTRADIYGLGMVLHELLCGKLPYSVENLPITEAATVIRHARPRRLSTYDRSLRGDLETIVFKAVAKEPDARYASVSEFAADISAYLRNEPIRARPASALYQFRMFARRNRTLVAATMLAGFSLVFAAAISVQYGFREARQRQRIEQIAELESAQRQKAETVKAYLIELLSAADPDFAAGEEVTVQEMLDRFADRLANESLIEPSIAYEMNTVIGSAYASLGQFERAGRHYREALRVAEQMDSGDAAKGEAQRGLGIALVALGDYAEAERVLKASIAAFRSAMGPADPQVAQSLEAISEVYRLQGQSNEAIDVLKQAIDIYREHPEADNGIAANGLGVVYSDLGRYELATKWYERGHQRMRAHFGADHKHVASVLNNRATLFYELGRYDEAIELFREALEIYTRLLGSDHVLVAHAENNLGMVLREKGEYAQACDHLEVALGVYRRNLGDDHPLVAKALNNVGTVLIRLGEYDRADRALRQAQDLRKRVLPQGHPDIAVTRISLAQLCAARGDFPGARQHLLAALAVADDHATPDHPVRAQVLHLLGTIENQLADWNAAEGHLREARKIWRVQGIGDSANAMRTEEALGVALTGRRQFAAAERTLLDARKAMVDRLGEASNPVRSIDARLAALYQTWGEPGAAARVPAAATPNAP